MCDNVVVEFDKRYVQENMIIPNGEGYDLSYYGVLYYLDVIMRYGRYKTDSNDNETIKNYLIWYDFIARDNAEYTKFRLTEKGMHFVFGNELDYISARNAYDDMLYGKSLKNGIFISGCGQKHNRNVAVCEIINDNIQNDRTFFTHFFSAVDGTISQSAERVHRTTCNAFVLNTYWRPIFDMNNNYVGSLMGFERFQPKAVLAEKYAPEKPE